MSLTTLQHQKAAALQEISSLSRPGGMARPAMMKNLVNRMIPLISQWERSDPEFARLGMLLRRARVKPTPNTLATVSAQAQRMVSRLRTKLPNRRNREGERQVWDPSRGHVTSPMFEEGEPVRTFSPMGWRGSKKYPFGKAFPEQNLIGGLSGIRRPGFLGFGKGGPAPAPAPAPPSVPPPETLEPLVNGDPIIEGGGISPTSIEEALKLCEEFVGEEREVCNRQIMEAASMDAGQLGSKKPLIIGIFMLLLGGAALTIFLRRRPRRP